MATYAYVRVSTDRQADTGQSLEVQQRQIEGYCQMQGLGLERVFVEGGVSGSVPLQDRPQGSTMLAGVKSGDAIVTAKLDRLFRSAVDALNVCEPLQQESVGLHMIDLGGDVTGNGISKLVFTILSAVAEAERDRIRERIRDVKADQKQRRRYLGGSRPFGYQPSPDGSLEPLEAEQAAIQRMATLRIGGLSLQAIASAIKEEFGFKLSHNAVKRVLRDA